MALRILSKIPGIRNLPFLAKYDEYLRNSEFKIDPMLWLSLSVVASIIIGVITLFFVKELVGLPQYIQFGILLFIVAIDLLVGYPYFKAQQRIDQIEETLPDALRQMADTLKAGGTYEYALREIAMSEYGPLKKEMNEVLRKLEDGENFENSLKSLSENVDSRLVKRSITIIIDSIRAGAGLASVLEEISEDIRETHRINKERKTRTVMQVIFMVFAGAIIAPIIFGFVSTISTLLIKASAQAAAKEAQEVAISALETITLSIQIFIFIETFVTSVMISIMRDGKATKSIIYFPVLLFIAYLAYVASELISKMMIGL